ncbi:MAG: single-stranded DNA-binding protein [Leptolyngbyaceae cyanobacterium]
MAFYSLASLTQERYSSAWPDRVGAKVIERDADGISKVVWCGHTYTRRTGQDKKKGVAIWYSRSTGQSEYGQLITFAAEPLSEYVSLALSKLRR